MAPIKRKHWKVIELYAGIGGFRAAWPESETCAAFDINQLAQKVYKQNFSCPYHLEEIQNLDIQRLLQHNAKLWWLSPPCQPFSRRGKRRDTDDPRTHSLLHLARQIETPGVTLTPEAIILENVVGFEESKTKRIWCQALSNQGYSIELLQICPSDFGWPNRRPRIYVVASRNTLKKPAPPRFTLRLSELLEPSHSRTELASLWLPPQVTEKFWEGLDRVSVQQVNAITACFGSSYGKSLLRSGSYLHVQGQLRRFSPREVARLLGFPDAFSLEGISARQAWKLLGNSLSILAVRYVLAHLKDGPATPLPTHAGDLATI